MKRVEENILDWMQRRSLTSAEGVRAAPAKNKPTLRNETCGRQPPELSAVAKPYFKQGAAPPTINKPSGEAKFSKSFYGSLCASN